MSPIFFSTLENFDGVQIVNVNLPASFGVTSLSTNILVAATQLDGTGAPFIGDASIEILNIAPFEKRCEGSRQCVVEQPRRISSSVRHLAIAYSNDVLGRTCICGSDRCSDDPAAPSPLKDGHSS